MELKKVFFHKNSAIRLFRQIVAIFIFVFLTVSSVISESGNVVYKIPTRIGDLGSAGKTVGSSSFFYDEILRDLSDYYGWEYEYVSNKSYLSSFLGMESGKYDFLYDVYKVKDWEENGLIYSMLPSGRTDIVILVRSDDERFSMTNLHDLNGKRLGFEAGNPVLDERLREFREEYKIIPSDIYFGTQAQMLSRLIDGNIDYCVISTANFVTGTRNICTLSTDYVYFASCNKSLIDSIDDYVFKKYSEDPFYFIDLYQKNASNMSLAPKNFTEAEKDLIKREESFKFISGDLVQTSTLNKARKSYFDALLNISGIEIKELGKEKKDNYSFSKKLHFYEALASEGKMESCLANGNYVSMSKPFYEVKARLIIGKDINFSDLTKKSSLDNPIIVETTTDLLKVQSFFTDRFPGISQDNIWIRNNTEKCLTDLENGKCSVVIVNDFYITQKYQLSDFNLLQNGSELYYLPISFVAESGSLEEARLASSILDKTINRLPENFYGMLLTYYGLSEKYSQPINIRVLRIIFSIVLLIVIMLSHSYIMMVFNSRKYKKMALSDAMTGIMSSMGFEAELSRAIISKTDKNIAVMEFNIRGFSALNKLHGTQVGDKIINSLAELLCAHFGQMNVCRSYGDHFYAFMVSSEKKETIIEEVYRLQQRILEELIGIMQFRLVIKTGMVFCPDVILDPEVEVKNLMSCAEYARKTKGLSMIDNFCLFDESLQSRREDEEKIDASIEKALENESFYVVYQPKQELKSGKIRGAEALVRWSTSDGLTIEPERFIEILEGNGYIEKLDFYVYRKTFEFMEEMLMRGEPLVPISLNVSRMCYNAVEFVDRFYNLFKEFDIPSEYVELEIEERFTAGAGDDNIGEMTSVLKKLGFRVSMDDFGTGESSLNMLSEIPVDIVKFDRAFLRKAETSQESRIILGSLIAMMKKLGKTVLCEGVETSEQIGILKSMECDLVQGYYYSKPLKKDDFHAFLKENY